MTIHEKLILARQALQGGGDEIVALCAVLKTPLWACRAVKASLSQHQDGTLVPLALIKPGYMDWEQQ